jgi:hypothetical protein
VPAQCAQLAVIPKTTASLHVKIVLQGKFLTQAALNVVNALLVDFLQFRAANAQIAKQVPTASAATVQRFVAIAVLVQLVSTHPQAVVSVLVATLDGFLL